MGVFTPAAFKTLRSDTERVIRVGSLVSPRGKSELLRLLGMAEKNVIVVESFLSHAIFEDDRVAGAIGKLASKGHDIRICFRKTRKGPSLSIADMVGVLKRENPRLVKLKLKYDRIRLFVNKTVIEKHFYVVDNRHVCVELTRGRDPYGPATFFYDDEEFAGVWAGMYEDSEKDRVEIKRKDLHGSSRKTGGKV
ncbi:MAG: hypothetical protein ACYSWY_05765 [Planctomycetota bacterium]|jgi:hypothetical protein